MPRYSIRKKNRSLDNEKPFGQTQNPFLSSQNNILFVKSFQMRNGYSRAEQNSSNISLNFITLCQPIYPGMWNFKDEKTCFHSFGSLALIQTEEQSFLNLLYSFYNDADKISRKRLKKDKSVFNVDLWFFPSCQQRCRIFVIRKCFFLQFFEVIFQLQFL